MHGYIYQYRGFRWRSVILKYQPEVLTNEPAGIDIVARRTVAGVRFGHCDHAGDRAVADSFGAGVGGTPGIRRNPSVASNQATARAVPPRHPDLAGIFRRPESRPS